MYFETSAKEGDNIDYVFTFAAEKLLEFYSANNNNNAIIQRQATPNNEKQINNFQDLRIEQTKKKKCCL